MDIKKRLFRKPMTTALWTILVAAMALLLGIGCAMMYSSGSMAGILDAYHTSVAVRTDRDNWEEETPFGYSMRFEDKSFFPEDAAYFESLKCVDEVYFHTLTAAYIPGIQPAISAMAYADCDDSYSYVLAVGEVTELMPIQDFDVIFDRDDGVVGVFGVLKLEEMVCQYQPLTRRIPESDQYINFWFHVSKEDAAYIQTGQRYVIYGQYDPDTHGLYLDDGVSVTPIHPWIKTYNDAELIDGALVALAYRNGHSQYWEGGSYEAPAVYGATLLKRIDGSFADFIANPENENYIRMLERMKKQHASMPVMGTDNLNTIYAFVNNQANIVDGRTFTAEEYDTGAKVCVLNEAVAIKSGISVGDTITMEQYLCQDLNTYTGFNLSLEDQPYDSMQNNPNIGRLNLETEYAPAEEFTVVGLYRLRDEWADSSYSFPPNLVFIPKAAQIEGGWGGPSEEVVISEHIDPNGDKVQITEIFCEGTFGIYFSIKLKNGHVSEFEELMAEDPRFAGQFITIDQGFGKILESINGITASTGRLTGLVCLGWALLLMLYMLLYQGVQRRNLGIMRCLGATPREAAGYLWGSGMTVAAVGITVGTALTGIVMQIVQSKMYGEAFAVEGTKFSESVLTQDAVRQMVLDSQIPAWALLILALAEMAAFALVLWLHASRTAKQEPRTLLTK